MNTLYNRRDFLFFYVTVYLRIFIQQIYALLHFQMENSNDKAVVDYEAANLKDSEPEISQEEPLPVIIDLSRVVDIDFTAAVVRIQQSC